MARFKGLERGGSLLARLAFFASRKKVGKVVAPVRIHALHNRLLFAYGQMELAQEGAKKVPAHLKALAQVLTALRIGCPF